MARKLIIEIPITETQDSGNTYFDLDFKAMRARTDLPPEEREAILEVYGQSDYIYTDLGRDLLTAFYEAPAEGQA